MYEIYKLVIRMEGVRVGEYVKPGSDRGAMRLTVNLT